jgi:hypothetical protein
MMPARAAPWGVGNNGSSVPCITRVGAVIPASCSRETASPSPWRSTTQWLFIEATLSDRSTTRLAWSRRYSSVTGRLVEVSGRYWEAT